MKTGTTAAGNTPLCRTLLRSSDGLVVTLSALAVCALLAGCGRSLDAAKVQPAGIAQTLSAQNDGDGAPPLMGDDGQPTPSLVETVPAEPAARTWAGRYASAAQADRLQRALGSAAWRIDLGCCNDAATRAALVSWADRALYGPPPRAVLVEGDDAVAAADIADRIEEAGLGPVWVVTP